MEKQIFYHDTDAGGVVYYANYLKYMEEARTIFLDSKGLSIQKLHQQGFLYAVRKCEIAYKSPARYGDIITCETILEKISAAQMIFNQKIFLKSNHLLLVEATVYLVSLNKDFKPTPIPDNLRELLV